MSCNPGRGLTPRFPALGYSHGSGDCTPRPDPQNLRRDGSNEIYLDKNHGASLISLDRMIGAFQPETERVLNGVTTHSIGHNPLKVQLIPRWNFVACNGKTEKRNL